MKTGILIITMTRINPYIMVIMVILYIKIAKKVPYIMNIRHVQYIQIVLIRQYIPNYATLKEKNKIKEK